MSIALFADNDVAFGLAVVTLLSTTVAGFFAFMTTRDKLRSDAKTVAQERDILHLNDRLTASENDRKEITERLIKAETEYAACREDRQTLHDSLHAVRLELGIVKALLKTQLSGDTPDVLTAPGDPSVSS